MPVTNALAGVAVSDLFKSIPWYSRLLDREPDAQPMAEVAEWKFEKGGWIQIFKDKDRAGSSSVTLVVDNLDERLADLKEKRISILHVADSKLVKTAIIADPDGNQIVFAQSKTSENRAAA